MNNIHMYVRTHAHMNTPHVLHTLTVDCYTDGFSFFLTGNRSQALAYSSSARQLNIAFDVIAVITVVVVIALIVLYS